MREEGMASKADADRATETIGPEEEQELLERVREGIVLHREGKLDDARRIYKEVLAIQPCNASALNFLGVLAHQQHQHPEAERLIATAVVFDPQYVDAYNNLGNVFDEQGKTIEAGLCFQRALQIRPDFRPALMNLGVVLRRMRRLDDATRVFEGLLQDEPDDYEALRNYGMVLLAKGEADRAVHQLRKAVQIKPCTESRYAVGMALYAADRLEEAGEIFLGWLEQEPDNPIAQHMAPAYVKQKHGTPARASDSYVRAIFDSFATSFERVLEGLDYQVPGMIGKVLQASYGDGHRNKVILDAGCGTGLCGLSVRPHAARLVGVDLSPGMLAAARAAENYDAGVGAEVTEYLSAPGDMCEAVGAAAALC